MPDHRDRFRGLILGTAVGDALGLPAEGISRTRVQKLFTGRWRHCFLFGRGMVSDDTDHTVFVVQSLLAHPDSPGKFAERLAQCLKWWFLSLPAGIGWATLRAIFLLWAGFPPDRSGIFSAGNGAAMRSAPIGAFFSANIGARENFVRASTRLTHTDPKAMIGAKAVADIAAWIIMKHPVQRPCAEEFSDMLARAGEGENTGWEGVAGLTAQAALRDLSVCEFADMLGLSTGVSGYVYHTVPVALYAWYRHFGDFEATLSSVLNCGGDTDTAGAIAGALAGAVTGESGIPKDWMEGIWEWPRSVNVLREMADRLEEKSRNLSKGRPVKYFLPGILPRNLFFLCIVLFHGFRRLFPPY